MMNLELDEMSIKERPAKKKEGEKAKSEDSDQNILDWLDDADSEVNVAKPSEKKKVEFTPENVKISDQVKPQELEKTTIEVGEVKNDTKTNLQIFMENLPRWLSKPWMYIQPQLENQVVSWTDSWKTIILDYSRLQQIHVVNLSELRSSHPFANSSTNKTMSKKSLEFILDQMMIQGLAKWLDDHKLIARIKYKTDDEWSEIIYDFLVDTGYAAEILTLYEIEKIDQEWTTIPRDELVLIFDLLVNKGRAEWIGETKDTLRFNL